MKSLTLDEKSELAKALKNNLNPHIRSALGKIMAKSVRVSYVRDKKRIKEILRKAFRQKKDVRIQYYSLSSDETRYRNISIYQLGDEWVIAYCHLRQEKRTFVIKRILAAALLKDDYRIQRNWQPRSIVRSAK
ncbi:MAG: WYL domain-containing protein [Candidatus Woesearchaeota archaeon]